MLVKSTSEGKRALGLAAKKTERSNNKKNTF